MNHPKYFLYIEDHEWALVEGDIVTVGITEHAQDALGDVVFVELPELEAELDQGESFGVVESVKAVNDLYAPCDGLVVEVNERLNDEPELVNSDPHSEGWILKIKINDPSDIDHLMNAEAYQAHVESGG
jgi:glycine cleavage system H protein